MVFFDSALPCRVLFGGWCIKERKCPDCEGEFSGDVPGLVTVSNPLFCLTGRSGMD
jgi:hypothetical protein